MIAAFALVSAAAVAEAADSSPAVQQAAATQPAIAEPASAMAELPAISEDAAVRVAQTGTPASLPPVSSGNASLRSAGVWPAGHTAVRPALHLDFPWPEVLAAPLFVP